MSLSSNVALAQWLAPEDLKHQAILRQCDIAFIENGISFACEIGLFAELVKAIYHRCQTDAYWRSLGVIRISVPGIAFSQNSPLEIIRVLESFLWSKTLHLSNLSWMTRLFRLIVFVVSAVITQLSQPIAVALLFLKVSLMRSGKDSMTIYIHTQAIGEFSSVPVSKLSR